MSHLGSNIFERRRSLGLSQAALADKAQLSQKYISDLERGTRTNAGLEVLERLAGALQTTVPALVSQTAAVAA